MSLFSDRKYCKSGKDEEDMILGYMAERGKKSYLKKKKIQQQRERKNAWMTLRKKKITGQLAFYATVNRQLSSIQA